MQTVSLTIKQATEASGLSRSALYVAMRDGKLPAKKAGRRRLILASALSDFIEALPNATTGVNNDPTK